MARFDETQDLGSEGQMSLTMPNDTLLTESDLISTCLALIEDKRKLSVPERELAASTREGSCTGDSIAAIRLAIRTGRDALGEAFSTIRSGSKRRSGGAVYTPQAIVQSMIAWIGAHGTPARVIDPGAGSGRFILAAAEAFPVAELIAVESDPLAALMLRANLSVRNLAGRASVLVKDYRDVALERCGGATAFVGNPPYVRHHEIVEVRKRWYSGQFARLGIKASALAGLHLHFFLQSRLLASKGDIGSFVTSAEWLDVNYGAALRRLLTEDLGALALHVLEPSVAAFPGTATTAAITCFRVGETKTPVRVRSVAALGGLQSLAEGTDIPRERLRSEQRWSVIVRPAPAAQGAIELGDLFRVHRGQVTGANQIWIAGNRALTLPDQVHVPAVTRARDLIEAGETLGSANTLRRVIDLPAELDGFGADERRSIDAFLAWARSRGAHQGYIARHRKAWWSVGLKPPAPILCTYMARHPPQFTLNVCNARHINVAHGLYPREPLASDTLAKLVAWLNANVATASGRTYAGGLTKFEPKEIERLRVPGLAELSA